MFVRHGVVNIQRIQRWSVASIGQTSAKSSCGAFAARKASFTVPGASQLGTVLYFHFGLTAALARKGKE
jgi:hypothetical protein